MNNENSIGNKIQNYRKLKGMTQDELSKSSGIYLSTIKKYESGERNPKPDQLLKIAEALGISVTVFLDFDINTISDVLSIIMKLDEQTPFNISANIGNDGKYDHNSVCFSFDDERINEAICSFLEYKQLLKPASDNTADNTLIETDSESLIDLKNRLLLFNEQIKKIR